MSDINLITQLELIDDGADNEAFASISLNPTYQWAKIVVTDDQPNANNQRVPLEEFDNIIKTGIFAPIKMGISEITRGHKEAMGKPIGTITQLVKANNKIIALAALWKRERPNDIEYLKNLYQNGTPPNVSWELSIQESSIDDVGIESFKGISLNGLCVVSEPAYTGRTPFIAMASKSDESDNLDDKEEIIVNEDEFKQKISDLEATIADLQSKLSEKDTQLAELKEFKDKVEEEKLKETRIAEIKQKFESAKIEKDETFWAEKTSLLLEMEDAAIDFMIQELVAFAEKTASVKEVKNPKVPNFTNETAKEVNPKQLGMLLRASKQAVK